MELGAFSVTLAVKDMHASKQCYETLGFEAAGGDNSHNWLILRNGETVTERLDRSAIRGQVVAMYERIAAQGRDVPRR